MTNEELKKLEDKLWDAANSMRAYGGIKAADYAVPVLGLIFLRFADNKYAQFEDEINEEFEANKDKRTRREKHQIAIEKCGFYLEKKARYEYLLNLPGNKRAQALKDAMELIEKYQDEKFKDVLPKESFFEIEKKKDDILPQLLKDFKDIPKDASGDVFGKIYEYFLGKFAMSEGQKGGEFFTPTSVVRFIVEVIEPYKGKLYDPACGSGGMFVQSAKFIKEANKDTQEIYVEGQEHIGETVRLAKMNLMVNNLRGEVIEANSYKDNPFEGKGRYDFVMANPPFNVKTVKESDVKDDDRFTKYGLPKNKGKNEDKISDANYLWISLFATSLNETGRSGFVMANSACDARGSEYEIRKRIVDSGIVDCMVSMPSNMFYTVILPATLWFFDKRKVQTERKDKILFIDARNVYNQIDRAHREWTEEQIQNLSSIVRLHRGENERFLELIQQYLSNAKNQIQPSKDQFLKFEKLISDISNNMYKYYESVINKHSKENKEFILELELLKKIEEIKKFSVNQSLLMHEKFFSEFSDELNNHTQQTISKQLELLINNYDKVLVNLKKVCADLDKLLKLAEEKLKLKKDKYWNELFLNKAKKQLDIEIIKCQGSLNGLNYWFKNISWLQSRFPKAKYNDVIGLCKSSVKSGYIDEHDYSMNPGRYVGVSIESDTISEEEFKSNLQSNRNRLKNLIERSNDLENEILVTLSKLL
jgi:type I restriction enzyme M protein